MKVLVAKNFLDRKFKRHLYGRWRRDRDLLGMRYKFHGSSLYGLQKYDGSKTLPENRSKAR